MKGMAAGRRNFQTRPDRLMVWARSAACKRLGELDTVSRCARAAAASKGSDLARNGCAPTRVEAASRRECPQGRRVTSGPAWQQHAGGPLLVQCGSGALGRARRIPVRPVHARQHSLLPPCRF